MSPYPLCFFTMDGHLITCNPAARKVFGETIWLQSDIFGMNERERRGLNLDDIPITGGSFRIERTERRTAYEVRPPPTLTHLSPLQPTLSHFNPT